MNNLSTKIQKEKGTIAFDIWMIIRAICSRDPNIRYSKDDYSEHSLFLNDIEIASLIKPYQEYMEGRLSAEDFFELLYPVAISFRNETMRKEEHGIEKLYTKEQIAEAEKHATEFRNQAHQLIVWKIGAVPDLAYSADEQWAIRCYFESLQSEKPHNSISDCARNSIVQMSITRMQFREVVAKEGWDAADKLPLLWFDRDEIIKEIEHL